MVKAKNRKKKKMAKPAKLKQHFNNSDAAKIAAPQAASKKVGDLFEALVALQATLRAPGGCPWDREQTHESLRTYLIEEAYEVLDALESGHDQKFAGELGDLLLQVIFHSELAAETGRFTIGDVIEHVHNKMVRRHPHVFGTAEAETSAQVLKNWEELKAEERRAEQEGKPGKGNTAKARGKRQLDSGTAQSAAHSAAKPASILDAVPRNLPALLEAHQLTRRASNVGFDWRNVEGIFDKLAEETAELHVALANKDRALIEDEAGDILFVCVNLARFLGLDAEITLKKANRKFSGRFRKMEQTAAAQGQTLGALSTDQLEDLWNQAKAEEEL
jgi:MazG family protein